MLLTVRLKRVLLVTVIFSAYLMNVSLSQRVLRYTGTYNINKLKGEASFDYSVLNRDTVFNGSFDFKTGKLSIQPKADTKHFHVKGSTQNNMPIKQWRLTFGEFSPSGEVEKQAYTYNIKLKGSEVSATGGFSEGRFDGKWQHTVKKIEQAVITDTIFSSQVEFRNGVPEGQFSIATNQAVMAGRFLNDGLAHDSWELFTTENLEAKEIWYFNQGRLEKIVQRSSDSIIQTVIFPIEISQKKLIDLSSAYLELISLKQKLLNPQQEYPVSELSQLLETNQAYFNRTNEFIGSFLEIDKVPSAKVFVPYFPLDKKAVDLLDTLQKQLNYKDKATIELFKNTQLSILRLAEEEVAYQSASLNYINRQYLEPLSQLINYYEKGVVQYIDLPTIVSFLLPNNENSEKEFIAYEWSDTLKTKRFITDKSSIQTGSSAVAYLSSYSKYWLTKADSLYEGLNAKLEKEKRQIALDKEEEKLMLSLEILNQKIDSLEANLERRYVEVLAQMKTIARNKLSTYSRIKGDEQKIMRAQLLAACFDSMRELAEKVGTIPALESEIKEKYTDEVWNPFTSTLMKESVKKRIVKAYIEILIPSLVGQISPTLNCTDIPSLEHSITELHERMLQLRTEDTKKLERRLRNESDPKVIFELFGLSPIKLSSNE